MRYNVLGQDLRILWSQELRVVRQADIDQTRYWDRQFLVCVEARGRNERYISHAVAIDFSYVEVSLNFLDFWRRYPVGGSPSCWWRVRVLLSVRFVLSRLKSSISYMICQCLPKFPIKKSGYSAGVLWCATMIFASNFSETAL